MSNYFGIRVRQHLNNAELSNCRYMWTISPSERNMLAWLIANVGPSISVVEDLPMFGEGWTVYEGHKTDSRCFDYGLVHHNHHENDPDGMWDGIPYGFWVAIDDDYKAVAFKLSSEYDAMPKLNWGG